MSNLPNSGSQTTGVADTPGLSGKPTNFRWVICGLLLYATTVNYIDRSTLNALEPTLKGTIGWRDYQYGLINAAFTLAYAIGFLVMGRLIDAVGTRIGYAVSIVVWSLSAFATVFTKTPFQFGMARFGLGLGEAGNFPAAIKTVAEWFPQRQRATATGIFNAGSNVGAIIAPLLALLLVPRWGWQAAFLVTPLLSAIWICLWLYFYRTPVNHPLINQAERDLINEDTANDSAATKAAAESRPKAIKWRFLLPHRQAWAFMAGKFLTDPIWWFYLFWSGKFFKEYFGVDLKNLALPLIYIYVLADVGSVAGGWLSSALIRRGWTPNAARKTAMWICAIGVFPVIFAPQTPHSEQGMWIAATLIGIAAACHQGFSANIFSTTSDMFPKRAISSIVGLGGLAGALGGMILQTVAGVVKEITGSYVVMFVIAGTVYSLAMIVIQILAPTLRRVDDESLESTPMPRLVSVLVFAVLGFVVAAPLSFLFQNHDLSILTQAAATQAATNPALSTHGFTFTEYLAAILPPGNIYQSVDRAELLPRLLWSVVGGIGISAFLGLLLHPVLFRSKSK